MPALSAGERIGWRVKSLWIAKSFGYDGTQLRSLFAYLDHGILGDSIVAWRGPCDVSFDHMVDGEDLLQKSAICGGDMLHFIVEQFDTSLKAAVALQRLLASIVKDQLFAHSLLARDSLHPLRRDGDDIFWDEKKLSISIATVSPTSSLIHFAVNVTNEGTPVATCALKDFGLDPENFANSVMQAFVQEVESVAVATQKVKWVK